MINGRFFKCFSQNYIVFCLCVAGSGVFACLQSQGHKHTKKRLKKRAKIKKNML